MSPVLPPLRQSIFLNVPPFINYLPIPDEKQGVRIPPAQVTPPVDLHVRNQIMVAMYEHFSLTRISCGGCSQLSSSLEMICTT